MAKKFLTGLNLVVLDTDPATGSEGELYFNSSASVAKIYQAGAWSVLGAGGGGTTVSTTEPPSPEIGDSWYKNDTGEFYVYDGTYWVEVNGVVSLSQEEVQDYVAPLFTSASGTNVVAIYDDVNNVINLNTSGSLISVDSIVYPDYITFDTTPEIIPTEQGSIYWDEGDLGLRVITNNTSILVGQEQYSLVKNDTGSTIAKGKVVYINGAQGQRPTIALSDADFETTSTKTFGITAEEILDEAEGVVITEGILRGINTAGFTEGAPIWLSTTAGNFTQTVPIQPSHGVFLGYVVKVHASSGEIFVKIQNGYELEELHNVLINGVSEDQVLRYDNATSLWKNQLPEQLLLEVYNNSGSVIPALSPVYYVEDTVNGINVAIADSNSALDPNKIPAIGISKSSISSGSVGNIVTYGKITGINTNDFDSNDSLFVASGGGLTSSRPTGTANVQEVGKVLVGQSASAGQILVYNTGRKNDIPNLAEGKVWIGNITSYPVATTLNTAAVPEGPSGPYYFTNERAVDALDSTLADYLTTASAASIYLTQNNASSTYLTQSNASAIYQPVGSYLTTETDPVFSASDAAGITSTDTSNWDTAYSWGNHASAGYALSSHNHSLDSLSNVVITGTPTDGQAIVWDTSTSKWVNETVSGGGASYPDQTGNDGKFLQTNGASVSWQNVDFTGYLTESSASSTYLTQVSASSTYQPIGSYLTSESDTLETITDRGATSSNAISITNTTPSTSTSTGALVVSGGLGVGEDVWIEGNLHVAGTTVTENTQTVSTHDNMIYLNAAFDSTITNAVFSSGSITYTADNSYVAGMDIRITGVDPAGFNISSGDGLTVASATPTQFIVVKSDPGASYVSGGIAHAKTEVNPDLGFAGGYYSAGYAHAGLFRDASDGIFKFFDGYTPEPDEAVNIDTGHVSFSFAPLKAESLDVVDASTTRTNLGLAIGSNVQAYNSTLAAVAGGTYTGDDSITTLGTIATGTWNGSTIGYQYGGTGLTSLGSAGYVLAVNGTATGLEWVEMTGGGGSSFTNSSELAALLSDETGSGSAVFATSPTLTTPVISGGTIDNASIGATTASTGRFTSVNINGQAIMEASTGTSSATSSFDTTVYSSAEFIVYGSTSTGNYVSKVLMLARGTATPVITEYAILTQGTAPTVTITPSYSAPNAVLTVGVTSGTNIEIIATEVSI